MRKVPMVVPVFTTSCQSDEKLKNGPEMAHTRISATAAMKACGLPMVVAVFEAARVNQ